MGQLAERARLSKQTMTTLVRLTERDGLVTRKPDPSDGRAARVWLTDRAREFRPVAERAVEAVERHVAARLTRAEIRQLRSALKEHGQPVIRDDLRRSRSPGAGRRAIRTAGCL